MNIWVDENGWPVPPIVLLGCLVAEILYFRGWYVLVREESAKESARAIFPSILTGSETGKYAWDSWLWRGVYFLIAIGLRRTSAAAHLELPLGRYEVMAGLISIRGYSAWIQLTRSSRLTVSSKAGWSVAICPRIAPTTWSSLSPRATNPHSHRISFISDLPSWPPALA